MLLLILEQIARKYFYQARLVEVKILQNRLSLVLTNGVILGQIVRRYVYSV